MPRDPRPVVQQEPPASTPAVGNSLVASAATMPKRRRVARPRDTGQDWQADAWHFYDTVGELSFGVGWLSNALSRVSLHVEQDQSDGERQRLEDGPPADVLDEVFGGEGGQSQMLAAFAVGLSVPGETYLVGEPSDTIDPETGEPVGPDRWFTASNDELTEARGKWSYDPGNGKRPLNPEALIIRIWRPHPRRSLLATSSVRAVLPVLREIESLTKHVAASVDSRLAGAGVFVVPSEMTFSAPVQTAVDSDETPDPDAPDPLLSKLGEMMMLAIEDRASAAALVPLLLKAPGAFIGDIKHLTFSTPLDEHAMDLRVEAIRRLALGLDIPVEVVLGQGDSNHWSAWQIEESALKVHIEPLLELICSALTNELLRPVLEGNGWTGDVATLHVIADTEDLRLRPDRSAQAFDLYDRFELSADALRRETGFEEEDAPDEDEVRLMILRKIATGGSIDPVQAAAAGDAIGLGLTLEPLTPPPSAPPVVGPTAPAPPPEETGPTTPPPEARRAIPEQAAAAGLLPAAEVLVLRALERANNRINRRGKVRRPFTPEACDLALADAWDHVPRVAALCGVEPVWLAGELDHYTRNLLIEGVEYSPALLDRVLTTDPMFLVAGPARGRH